MMNRPEKKDVDQTRPHEVRLPALGEGIDKAVVAGWNVAEGATVRADDEIVDLVTDKATFSVAAGCAGVVERILVKEGTEAPIGEILAVIRPV